MTIRLDDIKGGVNKVPLRALIYGAHGVGKSQFASQFPNPVFLDTEGNVDHLSTPKHRVHTWKEVKDFMDLLVKEDRKFNTLVIDSADLLEEFIKEEACAGQDQKNKNINADYGKAWGQVGSLLQELRGLLERLNKEKKMHIILISHMKTKKVIELDKGVYEMIMPRLHERVAPVFLDWCNLVGYAHKRLVVEDNIDAGFNKTIAVMKENTSGFGSRALQVGPSAIHVAKETFQLKKTPDNDVPLSAKGLLTQIKNFYDKVNQEKKGDN
jgi:hypothetical protein